MQCATCGKQACNVRMKPTNANICNNQLLHSLSGPSTFLGTRRRLVLEDEDVRVLEFGSGGVLAARLGSQFLGGLSHIRWRSMRVSGKDPQTDRYNSVESTSMSQAARSTKLAVVHLAEMQGLRVLIRFFSLPNSIRDRLARELCRCLSFTFCPGVPRESKPRKRVGSGLRIRVSKRF